MKKMLSALVVVVLMMTMLASVANAASMPFSSQTIKCVKNAEVGVNQYTTTETKQAKETRLYVRHYLYGDFGGVYTNHFQAANQHRNATTRYGGDWMAPDTANYVRSNSITLGKTWYAYARGNTDYGLATIVITGYSDQQA
ncbi:MAG: hypothetical protein VB099_06820 [Candidatus Limiplasma sp.]|nr:hypothetical protein [Candidatus Limiplasma sp.]